MVSGLISDARQLVENARQVASKWRNQYGSPIPLKALNDRLSMYIHAYTLYSAVRPFGCTVILSSYSKEAGPEMYMIDPSGVSYVGTFRGRGRPDRTLRNRRLIAFAFPGVLCLRGG